MRWLLVIAVLAAGCDQKAPITLGFTPKQHEPFFPIQTGAHAIGAIAEDGSAISCDSCHTGTNSFNEALCLSCHLQDRTPLAQAHVPVAGFAPLDAACVTCHPRGDIGDILGADTHSQIWFPINTTDIHGGPAYTARIQPGLTTCEACHADDTDRTKNLCADCHARDAVPLATTHASLPLGSFVDDEKACKECHADIPINSVMHPLTDHDAIIVPNHHGATCKDCHVQFRTGDQPWAIEFGVALCTKCHDPTCSIANQGPCLR